MGSEMGSEQDYQQCKDDSNKARLEEYAYVNKMFELDEYFVLGHQCRYGVPPKLSSKFDSNNNKRLYWRCRREVILVVSGVFLGGEFKFKITDHTLKFTKLDADHYLWIC